MTSIKEFFVVYFHISTYGVEEQDPLTSNVDLSTSFPVHLTLFYLTVDNIMWKLQNIYESPKHIIVFSLLSIPPFYGQSNVQHEQIIPWYPWQPLLLNCFLTPWLPRQTKGMGLCALCEVSALGKKNNFYNWDRMCSQWGTGWGLRNSWASSIYCNIALPDGSTFAD
jgi:hypothetical protein